MPTTNRPFFSNFFAAFRQHPQLPKTVSSGNSVLSAANGTSYSTSPTAQIADAWSATTIAPRNNDSYGIAGHSETQSTPHGSPTFGPPTSHQAHLLAAQAAAVSFRSTRPVHPPPAGIPTAQTRGRGRSSSNHTTTQIHQRHYHNNAPSLPPLSLPMPMAITLPSGSHTSSSPSTPPPPYPGNIAIPSSSSGYCAPLAMSQHSPPSPLFAASRSRTPSLTRAATRPRRGSDSSSEGWAMGGPMSAAAAEKWYIGGRTAQGEERFYKLALVRRYNSTDRLSLDRLSL